MSLFSADHNYAIITPLSSNTQPVCALTTCPLLAHHETFLLQKMKKNQKKTIGTSDQVLLYHLGGRR
jgi:hypothetical protein